MLFQLKISQDHRGRETHTPMIRDTVPSFHLPAWVNQGKVVDQKRAFRRTYKGNEKTWTETPSLAFALTCLLHLKTRADRVADYSGLLLLALQFRHGSKGEHLQIFAPHGNYKHNIHPLYVEQWGAYSPQDSTYKGLHSPCSLKSYFLN